jgi:hypothetical protein
VETPAVAAEPATDVNGVNGGVTLRWQGTQPAAASCHRWRGSRHREVRERRERQRKREMGGMGGGGGGEREREIFIRNHDFPSRGLGHHDFSKTGSRSSAKISQCRGSRRQGPDALDARTRARWLDASEQQKWMVARRRLSSDPGGQEAKKSGGGGGEAHAAEHHEQHHEQQPEQPLSLKGT